MRWGNNKMLNDIDRVLLSEEELQNIVTRLGNQISEDYKDKKILALGILKGSVVFLADLIRNINSEVSIDFMTVSSYGDSTETSGELKIKKGLQECSCRPF